MCFHRDTRPKHSDEGGTHRFARTNIKWDTGLQMATRTFVTILHSDSMNVWNIEHIIESFSLTSEAALCPQKCQEILLEL